MRSDAVRVVPHGAHGAHGTHGAPGAPRRTGA